jgi:endonuclease YncB( thermonuclease family)
VHPRQLLLIAVVLLAVTAPAGAGPRQPPEPVSSGRVHAVVDGDTLVLAGGTQVRLVGIQAPKLPLGRRGFTAWPLADESKAALEALAQGRQLRLSYGGQRIDRHNRLLAHLHDAAGNWIQGALLAQGMARVYTFADNRARAAEMLALEAGARAARRGIWGNWYYRVRDATETSKFIRTFQLVEGRVLNTAVVKRRGYLNFGPDWRTDFTVSIAPRHMRAFRAMGKRLEAYEGKRVRVRGWLKSYNGPLIDATHPEQIEVLSK